MNLAPVRISLLHVAAEDGAASTALQLSHQKHHQHNYVEVEGGDLKVNPGASLRKRQTVTIVLLEEFFLLDDLKVSLQYTGLVDGHRDHLEYVAEVHASREYLNQLSGTLQQEARQVHDLQRLHG